MKSKKKIVVIKDNTMSTDQAERFFEFKKYGACIQIVEDYPGIDRDTFLNNYLKMEAQGPDSLPLSKNIMEAAKDANALVSLISPIHSEVVNTAKELECIFIMRSGLENVDVSNASAHGIKVVNAAGRLAVPVSEFTIGLIISEFRNIARSHANVMQGGFNQNFCNASYSSIIKGKKIGIVGCGAIGKRVAGILSAMEANILVYDPYIDDKDIKAWGHVPVSLETLFSESDIITIHYRLTTETKDLIKKKHIDLMKPTAILVNTSRAGLVNENALIEALEQHKIGGAALDVFHTEPLPEDYPLLKLDNVTLTAHIAGTSSDIFSITFDVIKGKIINYLNGSI